MGQFFGSWPRIRYFMWVKLKKTGYLPFDKGAGRFNQCQTWPITNQWMPERGNHIHVSGVGFERLSWMAFLFEILSNCWNRWKALLVLQILASAVFMRESQSTSNRTWYSAWYIATGAAVPTQHLSHHEKHSLSSLSPVLSFLNSDMWAQSLEGTWYAKLHIKSRSDMRQDSLNSRCLTMIGNITKIRILDVQLLTSLFQQTSIDFCLDFSPPEIKTTKSSPLPLVFCHGGLSSGSLGFGICCPRSQCFWGRSRGFGT